MTDTTYAVPCTRLLGEVNVALKHEPTSDGWSLLSTNAGDARTRKDTLIRQITRGLGYSDAPDGVFLSSHYVAEKDADHASRFLQFWLINVDTAASRELHGSLSWLPIQQAATVVQEVVEQRILYRAATIVSSHILWDMM